MKLRLYASVCVLAAVIGCDSDGPEQRTLLTRHDPEPAGAHCANGGTAILAGTDGDGDGVLDDSEVEHTEYVCTPAATQLLRRDPLEPGTECPGGGLAVRVGIDDNGDGVLQDGEIDQTTYVCDSLELFEGDFTANDWLDPVRVAALQGAHVITGSLTIAGVAPVSLPLLEVVNGDLSVSGGLGVLALPALRQIGGNAEIDVPGIDAFAFPSLERVVGELFITGNGAHGVSIDAPELEEVVGRLVFWWAAKGEVTMPKLAHVGGALTVTGFVTGLHLDALVAVDGTLELDDLSLTSLTLPALETLAGDLSAHGTGPLANISLPALHELGGGMRLLSPQSLAALSLPLLVHVGGDVAISNAPALATLALDHLATVSGTLVIDQTPALTAAAFGSLATVGGAGGPDDFSVEVTRTGIVQLALPALTHANGGIVATLDPALVAIRLPLLTNVGWLDFIGDPLLETIAAPHVTQVQSVTIAESPQLHALDLGGLTTVLDTFDLEDAALTDLSGLHALAVARLVDLDHLPHLTDLAGLSQLRTVASLHVTACNALASLHGLERITQLSGLLEISQNPVLTSVAGLGNLRHVGLGVELVNDPALADLALTNLLSVDGALTLNALTSLASLSGLDALVVVGGPISLSSDPGLSAGEIAAFLARVVP